MDENRYGELLKELRPRIIETAEEHERLLTVAESLMEKGDTSKCGGARGSCTHRAACRSFRIHRGR